MNWDSASLMANVDKAILEAMGCEVELVAGSTQPTFTSMNKTGEPDVAPEFWADSVADEVDSAVGAGRLHIGNAEPINDLGEGWWIDPITLDANPELTTVEAVIARPDLFPDKEDPSKGAFYGCPEGWKCHLANINLFRAHDMEAKGWKLLDPGSPAGLYGSISKATEQDEPWVCYYWSPTELVGRYALRAVDLGPYAGDDNWDGCIALGADGCADPQPSGWKHLRVNTMLSDNLFYEGPEGAMDYFKTRTYPSDVMNSMLVWMADNQAGGADASVEFLSSHGDVWKAWVSAEVAAKVEANLQL
jgi:glycine betaine/proline transport system substrate-binding protein